MPSRPAPLSLPLPGHRRLVATAERGPDGDGRWYWRVSVRGDGRRQVVTRDVLTHPWATEAEVARAVGVYVAGAARPAGAWTLRDLLEEWLGAYQERATLSPYTQALALQTCTALSLLGGPVMDRPLERITSGDLEDLVEGWRRADGRPRAVTTRRLALSIIRQAWRWALARDRIDVRVPEVPRIRDPRPREKPRATREDAVALLEALHLPWHRAAVHLLWARGVRPGELEGLRVRDWSPARGELRVAGKTGHRAIPLGAHTDAGCALTALAEGQPPDASLWPVTRPAQALRFALRGAAERAGIPARNATTFRRAVVDRLYELDGDPVAAGAVVGHSPSTALLYRSRAKSTAVARAAAALDADRLPRGELVALAGGRPQPRPQGGSSGQKE